jgi:HD superfamily phosphohydrolase YqeK
MSDVGSIELPTWAQVTEKRRAHIERVTSLLVAWSRAMRLDAEEASAWYDAGRWHDALRDAPESELRALVPDLASYPAKMLHGPAAAARLARDGEGRTSVLEAIRWHTVGCQTWDRVGRALYMADYLDPSRAFARSERAFLAAQVIHDFDGTFRQVVRHRLEWALREGNALFPETVALWNGLR